jgi:short-subunit dehydrogenase
VTVVVTGASGGIGFGIAKALAERGHTVYSLSRSAPTFGGIKHIPCDISVKENVNSAFEEFFGKEPCIDLLINNAGIGISGAAEFAGEEDIKSLFNTNFHGGVYCSQCVIPKMRARNRGKIVFISSVGAIFTLPFQGFYSASKQAVNSFAETLAMELKPFHIKVGTVLFGDIRSGFTANRKKDFKGEDTYGDRIKKSIETMEKDELRGLTADKIGIKMSKYFEKRSLKLHNVVGFKYKFFVLLNKILPRKAIIALLYRIYG